MSLEGPRGSQKPDPDEPWRYRCPGPDCQSHCLVVVRGTSLPSADLRHNYRCRGCETAWRHVVDKKTGDLADPHETGTALD
jgi:hypothetical protein